MREKLRVRGSDREDDEKGKIGVSGRKMYQPIITISFEIRGEDVGKEVSRKFRKTMTTAHNVIGRNFCENNFTLPVN